LVFVNDGSSDGSQEALLELGRGDPNVRIIEFSRNFGHQMAILAGMEHARGDAIITMDGDLQHPPELIPELIEQWQAGYDVVNTHRQSTADAGVFKNVTSGLFYKLINSMSEVRIHAGAADFRLLDRRVVQALRTLGEHALFLRGLVSWMGYRQTAVLYDAQARYAGESKYSLRKMIRFSMDGIMSFSSVPLYAPAFVGLAISAFGFLCAALALAVHLFTGQTIASWTWVITVLLVLGGLQLSALGILGGYLGRIYDEVRARPRYLVRQEYSFKEAAQPVLTLRPQDEFEGHMVQRGEVAVEAPARVHDKQYA
jgi:dolichol-phosphate mannosyltransferase